MANFDNYHALLGLKILDPNEEDYLSYFDHVVAFNKALRLKTTRILYALSTDLISNVVISSVGSDARLEKYLLSPIELQISSYDLDLAKEAEQVINNEITKAGIRNYFCKRPELRTFNSRFSEVVLSENTDSPSVLISPNRIFDANFLLGNEFIFEDLRKGLCLELKEKDYGKSIYDRVKNRRREHKNLTLTGKQRYGGEELTHFSFEKEVSYYDHDHLHSFKQGPLRFVQYVLVTDLIKYLRSSTLGIDNDYKFISDLPISTVDKISFLEVTGKTVLSHEEVSDLNDNYKYFLWLYHLSQQKYREGLNETKINVQEVKERSKSLVDICEEGILKI